MHSNDRLTAFRLNPGQLLRAGAKGSSTPQKTLFSRNNSSEGTDVVSVSQPLQWGGTWNSRRSRTRGRDESVCRQNISDDLRLSLREYLAHRV